MDNTENDLMSSRYCNETSRCQFLTRDEHGRWAWKNREGDWEDERVRKRKKHRALKSGKIEESIALDRHFKPLIEPLRLFVDSPGVHATKRESRDEDAATVSKCEKKKEEK